MGKKVIVIGAGGVGRVIVAKCLQLEEVFSSVCLASRSIERCETIQSDLGRSITVEQVDADDVVALQCLFEKYSPDLVINVALPLQNLPIMQACLNCGVHYLDTSAPEPDPARYEMFAYRWQTEFHEAFADKGIMALLSLGFDPGITNVFCAYAAKYLFDELWSADILDCNGGDHGKSFATNFNPATNLMEVVQPCVWWENGAWQKTDPLTIHRSFDFPEIGSREMYLIYHEEEETLVKRFPQLKRLRFWMTFSDAYIEHLEVLRNIGMISLDPVSYEGKEVVPVEFLSQLLPDPGSLGEGYSGKINIGVIFHGMKDGKEKTYYLYVVLSHEDCYREMGSQAISYSTGVPAVLGAELILNETWLQPGVFLPEDLDPLPMMEALNNNNCKWTLTEIGEPLP